MNIPLICCLIALYGAVISQSSALQENGSFKQKDHDWNVSGTTEDIDIINSTRVKRTANNGNGDDLHGVKIFPFRVPALDSSRPKQNHVTLPKRVKRLDNYELILNVQPVTQQSENYCVVACCESLLRYFNLPLERVRLAIMPDSASYQDALAFRFFSRERRDGDPPPLRQYDERNMRFVDIFYGTSIHFVGRLNSLIVNNELNEARLYTITHFDPLSSFGSNARLNVFLSEISFRVQAIVRSSLANEMPVMLLRTYRRQYLNENSDLHEEQGGHATLIYRMGLESSNPASQRYGIMDPWTGTFEEITALDMASQGEFVLVHYDEYRRNQHVPERMEIDAPNYFGLAISENTNNPSLCLLDTLEVFSTRRKRNINSHVSECRDTENAIKIYMVQEYNEEPPVGGWIKKGALFIGTNHGVFFMNGDQVKKQVPDIKKFKLNTGISDIMLDHQGGVFVVDDKGDMYHLNSNGYDHVKYDLGGEKVNMIKVLNKDYGTFKKGSAYVGTNEGVRLKYGHELDKRHTSKLNLQASIRDIELDNRGSAFAISFDGNMFHLNLGGQKCVQYDLGGGKVNVVKVLDGNDGEFETGTAYIGTDKGVRFKYGFDLDRSYTDKFQMTAAIRDIVWDNRGSVFAVGAQGGLFHLHLKGWETVEYNLQGEKVTVLKVLDRDDGNFEKGSAYIGTDKGVRFVYGDRLDKSYTHKFNLEATIHYIVWDNRGSAFAVSYEGDMYHLHLKGWETVKYNLEGGKVNVLKVLTGTDGNFEKGTAYIGTTKGVWFKYGYALDNSYTDKFRFDEDVIDILWDNEGSAFAVTSKGDKYHLDKVGWGCKKVEL
ncbi:hypothetical protein QAD02_010632 [Eretmocerus hayati]|uniref:Uncharacterized protein n=1 Tax=Eretmocerus hayati TaxID=131215 RepID=A0ACC2NW67_9HYME|nr:hypothetical protein QAD02_010632 [Eretmocerus hayati]